MDYLVGEHLLEKTSPPLIRVPIPQSSVLASASFPDQAFCLSTALGPDPVRVSHRLLALLFCKAWNPPAPSGKQQGVLGV